MLNVKDLSVYIARAHILKGISFDLLENQTLMVIGPNGSGKTTLVRAIMNILPHEGSVRLSGQAVSEYKNEDLARRIGVLTQSNSALFSYRVREVVSMGRYAYKKGLVSSLSRQDEQVIDAAMEMTQTQHLSARCVTTLSGGELQRVCLARVFAQDPQILILDEPTNHLDIEHQLFLFDVISKWVRRAGRGVLSIVHDLNMAYEFGTHALLIDAGRVVAYGEPEQVLNRENLQRVYHVDLVAWMQSLFAHWQD